MDVRLLHRVAFPVDHRQVGAVGVVGNVCRAGREQHRLQPLLGEDRADAPVQLLTHTLQIELPLPFPHHLVEVGVGEEAQLAGAAVVEILRLFLQEAHRLVDKGRVHRRGIEAVVQLQPAEALERFVEGQGVEQHRAGCHGSVGLHPRELLGIQPLGQGPAALGRRGGHIRPDRRDEGLQPQLGGELQPNSLVARIHVVEVNSRDAPRLVAPELADGLRQQPQHAPHPLEVLQGGGLLHQGVDQLRMQRIALAQIGSAVIVLPHRRQGLGGAAPDVLVSTHHLLHPAAVDGLEQAPCQHLHRFVFAGGREGRDLPARDRLQLSEDPIDPLVFLPIGIHRLAALAQGQGEHQHRLGGGVHRLDQVGEEGSELLSRLAGSRALDLAQVDRELIDQDQHRPLADQLPQGFRSRGRSA